MAKLRVTIIDEVRSRRLKVDLPDDATMEKLLPALAKKLGLPPADYRLIHEATGRTLSGEQTLASFGVGEGDALRLAVPREETPAVPGPTVEVKPVEMVEEEAVPPWRVPMWAWVGIVVVVMLAVSVIAFLAGRGAKPVPTPTVAAEATTPAVTKAPTLPVFAPTATPAPPTSVPTSTPLPTATPMPPTATPAPPTATPVPPTPTQTSVPPTGTATDTPTPSYTIEFEADRTVVNPGEWVTLRWHVENVQAVYLDWKGGAGAPGTGEDTRQLWETTNHTLRVVLENGETVTTTITITVQK